MSRSRDKHNSGKKRDATVLVLPATVALKTFNACRWLWQHPDRRSGIVVALGIVEKRCPPFLFPFPRFASLIKESEELLRIW
jgi:hypothetical protein